MVERIIRAAVENTAYHFDKLYDYIIPLELRDRISVGARVLVPFGNGNRRRQAVVFEITDSSDIEKVKPLTRILDEEPLLSEEMLDLAKWIKSNYYCTLFEAARLMLPSGLNVRIVCAYKAREGLTLEELDREERLSALERQMAGYLVSSCATVERDRLLEVMGLSGDSDIPDRLCSRGLIIRTDEAVRRTGDATIKMVRLTAGFASDGRDVKLTEKQREVVTLLEQAGSASAKEICYFAGVTQAVLTGLKKKNIVEYFDSEVYRKPYSAQDISACVRDDDIVLTPEQDTAYRNISARYRSSDPSATLLYGVTGSGKTSVFMKLIDDAVADGRGVIVMVPEIALTPQTLNRFRSRYGDKTAVFHSALSLGQRMDEWKRVKRGEALIAVGTRSAVFAPFDDIGLIIIDEEQEYTYKSESSPRFHARDVARFRCARHNAALVLASATPSVESFYYATEGKRYNIERLTKRYGDARLPTVDVIDVSEQKLSSNIISPQLKNALEFNLKHGYQSILLHNRRGFNTFVACRACGEVLTCPHCSVSMTYHHDNGRLMCHYCGESMPFTVNCPSCGSDQLRYAGQGTQRAEDELARLFPDARVLRMDADSTMSRFAHEDKLKAFADGDYDIMIGTQMVAKGLDFERVTLVGVLLADQMLYCDDFRSYERAFSMLTQVVGRSGRGEFSGRAIIQTLTPENPVIAMAARQDYDEFFANEIKMRRAMLYPPFSDICMVGFIGTSEGQTKQLASDFLRMLSSVAANEYPDLPMRVLGPSPAAINKLGGKYRYKLIIKCRNSAKFRELMSLILRELGKKREYKDTQAFIDMNPDNVM